MAGKSTTASLLSVLTGVVTVSLSAVHTGVVTVSLSAVHTGASGENALQDVDGIAPNINSSSQELQRVASRSSFSTGQLSDFTSDPPVVTSERAELAFNSSVRPDVEVPPEECVLLQFSDFVPWDNPDNLISNEVKEAFEMFVGFSLVHFLYLIRYFML